MAAVCAMLSLVLSSPLLLFGTAMGLLLAAFPLLTRLDELKLSGPMLTVRKGLHWVGPIDLRELVAIGYRRRTHRAPAAWLLVQRDAGPRFRWHRTWNFTRETRAALAGADDLRVVEVAAGSRIAEMPLVAERLAEYASRSDTVIDPPARKALPRART